MGNIAITRNGLKLYWVIALAIIHASPAFSACGPAKLDRVAVELISKEGDIILADQRSLKLAGLHIIKPEALLMLKRGEIISIGLLSQTKDRWSRLPALVFTESAGKQEWLQERLIKDGVALARPDESLGSCWPQLTDIERHNTAKKIVSKADGGRFARVEGRVQRVSDGRTAKFIGLSNTGGERITGMILKRHLKRFSDKDVDVDKLQGQIIRIRGVRNLRNATIIALTSVDQIEILR